MLARCLVFTGQQYCGPKTYCNNTIGSFTCDTSNCYEGYTNWQPGKGRLVTGRDTLPPGCVQIIQGNRSYKYTGTNTVKELALNVGKVNVDKPDFL